MYLSVIISRLLLLLFCIFGIFINQFSSEKIENFLHAVPYRCPLRLITGWKCAFCGMTHSWIALFRGNLITAFHENFLGPILWLATVIVLVLLSLRIKFQINSNQKLTILLALIIYAVARNLIISA